MYFNKNNQKLVLIFLFFSNTSVEHRVSRDEKWGHRSGQGLSSQDKTFEATLVSIIDVKILFY